EVTMTFFGGDLVYSGRVSGQQMSGTVKSRTDNWNFNATQQARTDFELKFYSSSTGTGSLIDRKHRLVVTNCHVVGDAGNVPLYFPEADKGEIASKRDFYKRKTGYAGRVVMREERCDLALVQLEKLPGDSKVLPLSKASSRPASQVHSVGNPGVSGALWCYSPGRVRQIYRNKWTVMDEFEGKTTNYDGMVLETDSPINPGDSGGPLVNERGVMVGVAHGYNPGAQNFSLFIDVSEVRDLMKRYYQTHGETWVPEPEPTGPVNLVQLSEWVKRLTDEELTARVQAAEALGKLGDGARVAFGPLFQALKDTNPLVRRAVSDALEKI